MNIQEDNAEHIGMYYWVYGKKSIRKNAHQVNPISKKAHQENCPSAKVMGRKMGIFPAGLFSQFSCYLL